jgi:hypothetical protein
MSQTVSVTNIEAARRQLRTAIQLFFQDGDAVSVHTLVGAAREIFEKHCQKEGLGGVFDFPASARTVGDIRQTRIAMNAARNFFKHSAARADDSISFEDSANDAQLYIACFDCVALSPAEYPAEVHAFMLWILSSADVELTGQGIKPDDAVKLRAFVAEMDGMFPGLRRAPRSVKKRWGLKLLEHARVQSDPSFEQIGTLIRQYRQTGSFTWQ